MANQMKTFESGSLQHRKRRIYEERNADLRELGATRLAATRRVVCDERMTGEFRLTDNIGVVFLG